MTLAAVVMPGGRVARSAGDVFTRELSNVVVPLSSTSIPYPAKAFMTAPKIAKRQECGFLAAKLYRPDSFTQCLLMRHAIAPNHLQCRQSDDLEIEKEGALAQIILIERHFLRDR